MDKINILFVAGTRPELIKMAPVIKELQKRDKTFSVSLCATGQHKEMFNDVLQDFSLIADIDLGVMAAGQGLCGLTSILFSSIDKAILHTTDMVFVQGDTTSAMVAGICAFYKGKRVAHIEAGLRSGSNYSPFPEEVNRKILSVVADLHFAPTESAKNNLLAEGINDSAIIVTGNTVIDSLLEIRERVIEHSPYAAKMIKSHTENSTHTILVTGHRRESFGAGFIEICHAIKELSEKYSKVHIIYPVHLNPNVQSPVYDILHDLSNVHLINPLGYSEFVWLLNYVDIILTDSGGVQEEAPTFEKPVLVMRDVTERTEGIQSGTAKLVGTNRQTIVDEVSKLLDSRDAIESYRNLKNPYGDGTASIQIADYLERYFNNSINIQK